MVSHYAVHEEMKKVRYHDMLRYDIREFVSISGFKTLIDKIARAREQDIDLEHLGKREPEHVQEVEGPPKRPKTSDQ